MVQLGEIVSSIYLVTKVNQKGIVCEYLDITTSKRIITSQGGLQKNDPTIKVLTDDDLEEIKAEIPVEQYLIWKQGFFVFMTRLVNVVNSYLPPDIQFRFACAENCYFVDGFKIDNAKYDYMMVIYPDESLEYKLLKKQIPIKTNSTE